MKFFLDDESVTIELTNDNLVATLPKWGEYFAIFFELWIDSFSGSEFFEIVRFTSTENNVGSPGDRIPAIFVNNQGYITVASQVGINASFAKNININVKAWIKLEIKQYKENGEVLMP